MLKLTVYWGQRSSRMVGWSENFWRAGNEIDSAAKTACNTLISLLFGCKGLETAGLGHKISVWGEDGLPTRVSQLFTPMVVPPGNPSAPSGADSDYPTVAYLLEGRGGTPERSTRQWIRGILDGAVVGGGRIGAVTGLAGRNALINGLGSGGWSIRVRTTIGFPQIPLLNFDPITGRFLTAVDHGFTAGQRITLARVKTSPRIAAKINGAYRIGTVPNVKEFTLQGLFLPPDVSLFIGRSSSARRLTYSLNDATWDILRVTSRQAGRPFGSPSGRVSNPQ